jgi:hypothetical protein
VPDHSARASNVAFREKRLADSLARESHLNRAAHKIDVVPKQTEEFPAAQSSYRSHPNQDVMGERQFPEGANDLIRLWNTWRVDVSMVDAFRLRAGQFDSMRWIGRCDFTVDCLFENPMEQNKNYSEHTWPEVCHVEGHFAILKSRRRATFLPYGDSQRISGPHFAILRLPRDIPCPAEQLIRS